MSSFFERRELGRSFTLLGRECSCHFLLSSRSSGKSGCREMPVSGTNYKTRDMSRDGQLRAKGALREDRMVRNESVEREGRVMFIMRLMGAV